MPVPSGAFNRAHVLNLYSGINAETSFFFFWRNRKLTSSLFNKRTIPSSTWKTIANPTTDYKHGEVPSSTWGKATDADDNEFVKTRDMRDS